MSNTDRGFIHRSAVKAGMKIKTDAGFTCLASGVPHTVCENDHGLFIPCAMGQHYLDGQDDGDGYLVGLYPA